MLIQQHSQWIIHIVLLIVAVLGGFRLYARSGAGFMRRSPLLRAGQAAVTIYLLRGLVIVPLILVAPRHPNRLPWQAFLFCVVAPAVGLLCLLGTMGCWRVLSSARPTAGID